MLFIGCEFYASRTRDESQSARTAVAGGQNGSEEDPRRCTFTWRSDPIAMRWWAQRRDGIVPRPRRGVRTLSHARRHSDRTNATRVPTRSRMTQSCCSPARFCCRCSSIARCSPRPSPIPDRTLGHGSTVTSTKMMDSVTAPRPQPTAVNLVADIPPSRPLRATREIREK